MDFTTYWQQLKSGEKSALSVIYEGHVDLLYVYGCRFSRDHQLVEDCIQDLFVELWRNRRGLGDTDSVKRYLLAALRRKIYRHLKKEQRWVSADQQENLPFDVDLAMEDRMIASEISAAHQEKIKAAFDQLSKRQKEVIYLKYYAGMDYEDIESIMEINYQSLRNLVSSALKKMKQNVDISYVIALFSIFLP